MSQEQDEKLETYGMNGTTENHSVQVHSICQYIDRIVDMLVLENSCRTIWQSVVWSKSATNHPNQMDLVGKKNKTNRNIVMK